MDEFQARKMKPRCFFILQRSDGLLTTWLTLEDAETGPGPSEQFADTTVLAKIPLPRKVENPDKSERSSDPAWMVESVRMVGEALNPDSGATVSKMFEAIAFSIWQAACDYCEKKAQAPL